MHGNLRAKMKIQENSQDKKLGRLSEIASIATFEHLPIELQLEIFSYFTKTELCTSLGLVSKTWRHLAMNPSLWKEIRVWFPFYYDIRSYQNLLRCCVKLRVLKVRGCWHPFPREISICSHNLQFLKELHLKDIVLAGNGILQPFTWNCKLLETVCIVSCRIRANLQSIIFDVANLPSLKSFTFVNTCMTYLNDWCLKTICSKRRKTLSELKIEGNLVTDTGISHLRVCHKLESLHISKAVGLTWRSLAALTTMRLKSFKLNVPFYGGDIPKHVLSYVNSDDLVRFLSAPQRQSLQELGFERVLLDGHGLRTISQNCSKLQELSLRHCEQLSGQDIKEFLETRPLLNRLDLSGCVGLTEDIVLNIPHLVPNLERIEMTLNFPSTERVLEKFKQCLPELELDRWDDSFVFGKLIDSEDSLKYYSLT